MKYKQTLSFLLALGSVPALAGVAFSTDPGGDPNVEIRKLLSSHTNSALEDFEKVKRSMNDANIKHFTEVLAKKPKDAHAYAMRGKAYSGNKQYDKALEDFGKALEIDPKIKDAYVGRAVVYLMKKDFDNCWVDVHQAESLGGEFWPSFKEALKAGSGRDK